MKKTFATLVAIILTVAGLHAFRAMQQSTISGKIVPLNAADVVMIVNGNDSIKAKPANGNFTFTVKPGNWKVLIDAKQPFRNTVLRTEVQEGQSTDLGDIQLLQ